MIKVPTHFSRSSIPITATALVLISSSSSCESRHRSLSGRTLGLSEMLADAVPRKHDANALRVVSKMIDAELENVLRAFADALRIVLGKSADMRMSLSMHLLRPICE